MIAIHRATLDFSQLAILQIDRKHQDFIGLAAVADVQELAKFLRSKLPGQTELGLLYRELGRVESLVEDILLASLDSCILEGEVGSACAMAAAGLAQILGASPEQLCNAAAL